MEQNSIPAPLLTSPGVTSSACKAWSPGDKGKHRQWRRPRGEQLRDKKSELTASTLFFDLFIVCLCIRFNAALALLALLALGAIPAHHCFFRSRRGGRWPVAQRDRPRLSPSVRLRHHDSPTQRPNYLHLMIYPLNWCLATFVCAQMEKRLRRQTGKWQRFGK